ncbi:MAG TPA: ATP-binding protein [Vicinamibacterales bacterium]|nr:ATP-binding protein [Vicinamibacterales bacterium]
MSHKPWPAAVAGTAAVSLLAIGLVALLGWHTGQVALLTYGSTGTPLRYNAALSFVMLGAALHLLARGHSRPANWVAATATTIGTLTLTQYVLSVDLGIDRFFYGGYVEAPRMAPNAAFGIALAGMSIHLLACCGHRRRAVAAVAVVGGIVTAVGVTAAFGYAVDLPSTYVWLGLTPLSPPGALGITVLGAGLVASAWGSSETVDSPLPSWLPLAAGMLVMMVGVLLWEAFAGQEHSADLHTRENLRRVLPGLILATMALLAVAVAVMVFFFLRLLQQRTEIAVAEEHARRQATVLQRILDVLPVGVWVADGSGRIVKANASGELIWGAAPAVGLDEYVQYKGWWPNTGDRLESRDWALARALLTGETIRNEMVDIEAFDGQRKTILNSAAPLVENGAVAGAVVVVQDITERRSVEKALADRTRELERSNTDLEQFAYVASHDLQEPLRMVASFTQLLAKRYRGALGSDADEYIAFIVDGAVRMQRLLSDLLAYSRVGTRGRPITPVAAGEALRDALANLKLAIEDTAAAIEAEPLPMVLADAAQLTQVFQNLIANALKFRRDDRPPRVRITAEEGGGTVTLTVADNGIGVEERHSDRIFDIFRRLDTSGRYPGTGLGLAICKRIVVRHGGRVWVESSTGEGARFRFTLHSAGAAIGAARGVHASLLEGTA